MDNWIIFYFACPDQATLMIATFSHKFSHLAEMGYLGMYFWTALLFLPFAENEYLVEFLKLP